MATILTNARCNDKNKLSLQGGQTHTQKKKLLLQRQGSNTSRSSRSSGKSNASALQKRIEELCLQKQPGEWQKEQEYNFRRQRRLQLDKQISARTARVKKVQLLFMPAALGAIAGTVMTFGATIRTVSEGSILWTYREYFVVIGPILLTVSLILFFITEGMRHLMMERLQKAGAFEIQHEIHPDFHKTNRRQHKNDKKENDKVKENEKFIQIEESFLCSSISSTSSVPDFTSRWARAMSLSFEKQRLEERSVSVDSDTSADSALMRSLVNASDIEITDTDETKDVVAVGVKQMRKTDLQSLNERNGSVVGVENSKLFQGFYLAGISEESLMESS